MVVEENGEVPSVVGNGVPWRRELPLVGNVYFLGWGWIRCMCDVVLYVPSCASGVAWLSM